MAVVLPQGRQQFFDSSGNLLAAGRLYTYQPGTSTPKAAYTTSAGTTPHTNPIVLDARGEAAIYWTGPYDVVLRTSADALIWGPERLEEPEASGLSATLRADIAAANNATKGAGMVGYDSDLAYSAGTVGAKLREVVSVKDFGAVGDYNPVANTGTDDTAAFQAAADWLDAQQTAQLAQQKISTVELFVPEGCYKLSAVVKFHGMVVIHGVGAGWVGGSTIIQTGAANLFEFYGSSYDNAAVGVTVKGLNFGFTGANYTRYALKFPRYDDVATSKALSSNSLYFFENRFGGYYPYGGFLSIDHGNDIDIAGNIIDVCFGTTLQIGTDSYAGGVVTDAKIRGNSFYSNTAAVKLTHVRSVSVNGNAFFNSATATAPSIDLKGSSINAGYASQVAVVGNTFDTVGGPVVVFDASMVGLIIQGNNFYECRGKAISIDGATAINGGLVIEGNTFQANSANGETAFINAASVVNNAVLSGNVFDFTGWTAGLTICNEVSGASMWGTNCDIGRNIVRGLASPYGGRAKYVPLVAHGLEFVQDFDYAGSYPTNSTVFNFDTLAQGEYISFEIHYHVKVEDVSVDITSRTGHVSVNIAATSGGGATSTIAVVTSHTDGSSANYPTVTFSIGGTPLNLRVTISSAIAAPDSITLRMKMCNFVAHNGVQGKPV